MRQVRRSALFGLMMAAIVGTGSTASAQEAGQLNSGGWDLHLFRPAIDSKGHLSVNGSDILGHTDFSFGLVLDYGRGLLPFRGFVNDGTVMAGEAERVDRLVDNYFTGTLHFNIGLFNYVVVGFQLPIIFLQGQNVTVPGVYNTNDNITLTGGNDAQGIGDLTIHAKARILRAERDPIGLAAILRAQLPTGNDAQFTGEPGFTLWPSIVAEWRPVRRFRLSLEAGYRFNVGDGATIPLDSRTEPSETNAFGAMFSDRGTDLTYDDLITFGLGASIRAADSLDIVLESYGTQIATEFGTTGAFSAEALLGLKIFVQANSYLVLAGGAGFPRPSAQAADFRAVAGFIFEPSIGDRDGDGYKDDVDECPDEPEDFDNFADEEGCPDPDNDRDGILDVDDECPLVPEDRDGDADEDGCPEGNEGDRDGDGILDDVDECPDDPEDRDGFEDEDGCPDPDNDQDGILDQDDLCPNDPEDMDDFQDEDGCPDPDNDNDRILDVDDSCPTDPETYNGFEDEDGCPDADNDGDGVADADDQCRDEPEDVDEHEDADGCPDPDNDGDGLMDGADRCPLEAGPAANDGCPDTDRDEDGVVDRLDNCPDEPGPAENQGCEERQRVRITEGSLEILDKVYFATNSDRIQRRSFRLLANVAQVLNNHPEIQHVRVEGHTDDRGPDDRNLELSQKRAEAVVAWLVERGEVAAERLEARGFGETQPIESNDTREGRAANRRVEFDIVEEGEAEADATEEDAEAGAEDTAEADAEASAEAEAEAEDTEAAQDREP